MPMDKVEVYIRTPDPCNKNVSAKVGEDLKAEIQNRAEELGMTVSSLVRSVLEAHFR